MSGTLRSPWGPHQLLAGLCPRVRSPGLGAGARVEPFLTAHRREAGVCGSVPPRSVSRRAVPAFACASLGHPSAAFRVLSSSKDTVTWVTAHPDDHFLEDPVSEGGSFLRCWGRGCQRARSHDRPQPAHGCGSPVWAFVSPVETCGGLLQLLPFLGVTSGLHRRRETVGRPGWGCLPGWFCGLRGSFLRDLRGWSQTWLTAGLVGFCPGTT